MPVLPPDADEFYASDPDAYDVPRGTCPKCGSGEVLHHAFGMPASPDAFDDLPEWVQWGGCCVPEMTRSCAACGASWNPVRTW